MVVKTLFIKMASILVLVAFPFVTVSQTKHVSKWFAGEYLFDFTTNPVTISQLEQPFEDNSRRRNIYVDANGNVRLVQLGFALYDGDGNEIKFEGENPAVRFLYFIPKPNNDNIICAIGETLLYEIDIEKKKLFQWSETPPFPRDSLLLQFTMLIAAVCG